MELGILAHFRTIAKKQRRKARWHKKAVIVYEDKERMVLQIHLLPFSGFCHVLHASKNLPFLFIVPHRDLNIFFHS